MKIINKYFYPFCLFLLILGFIKTVVIFRSSTNNAFITPDETVNYTSLITFAKTLNFKVENKYSSVPDLNIIKPRGMVSNENYLVPAKYFGMSLYYGLAYKVIKDKVNLLTPIMGGVGLLITYFLVLLISGNKKTSLFSAVILAFFPPYFWWSRFSYMENIFGSVLFFLGFYLLTRFILKKTQTSLYLSSLVFGLSCGVRPDYSVLYIIPLIVFLVFFYKEIGTKKLIVSLLIFSFTILPILFYNKSLYGKFLTSGTHYLLKFSNIVPLEIKDRSLNSLSINANNIFIKVCNLFLFSILGLILSAKSLGNKLKNHRISHIIFILLSILVFSYILLAGVASTSEVTVNDSYTRYFLPLYLCSLPGLSLLIEKLSKKIQIISITSYIIFSVFFLNNQLRSILPTTKAYAVIKNNILINTENESVVFIAGLDKILYPDRQVASIDFSNPEIVINSIINLIKFDKTLPIYIYSTEQNETILNEIKDHLIKNNIYMIKTNYKPLYKIITKENSWNY